MPALTEAWQDGLPWLRILLPAVAFGLCLAVFPVAARRDAACGYTRAMGTVFFVEDAGAALTAYVPSPATHAILTQLKAGDTADLIYRVYKTLLDSV